MTQTLANIFYLLLFLTYCFMGAFVVYHFLKYSLNKTTGLFIVTLFVVGSFLLVGTNVLLFLSIPFDSLGGVSPTFLK